jgi:hypothetical protein
MIAPTILVALYPPPVRERWGNDLAREVAAGGPRSWLDTAAGAARLWAHPSDWPESTAGQTRRILIVELAAVAALVALLLRAAGRPSAMFTADLTHPATSAWLIAILVGLVVAAPLPPLRWRALGQLIVVCLRTLAAPAIALSAMYVLAQSNLIDHLGGALSALLYVYYWTSLALVGLRLCTLAGRIGHVAIPPSARSLRAATLLIGIGLAMAALQNLAIGPSVSTAALSTGLATVAIIVLATAHDLRRVPGNEQRARNTPHTAN